MNAFALDRSRWILSTTRTILTRLESRTDDGGHVPRRKIAPNRVNPVLTGGEFKPAITASRA
jgi:hypothetical protein